MNLRPTLAAVCLPGLVAAPAHAQAPAWPAKPLRLIVPFPSGGATDSLARRFAPPLGDALGQQVVIENRTGAGGMIGTDVVAKAPPDGYTMVMPTFGPISINPNLYAKMPFDPQKDLIAVSLTGNIYNVLVVHPALPAADVRGLIALARRRPGELNFGSSGVGAADHLAGELLQSMTRTKMVHVPSKGGPMAMVDLVGGGIQLMFATVASASGVIRANKVRSLAVTNTRRFPVMPDLPTVAEAGVPGFAVDNWCGLFVPAGTPAAIVNRLATELAKALAIDDVRQKVLDVGISPEWNTPEQFAAYVRAETVKWGKVIRDANVKGE